MSRWPGHIEPSYREWAPEVGSSPSGNSFQGLMPALTRDVKLALADPLTSSLPRGPVAKNQRVSKPLTAYQQAELTASQAERWMMARGTPCSYDPADCPSLELPQGLVFQSRLLWCSLGTVAEPEFTAVRKAAKMVSLPAPDTRRTINPNTWSWH